MEIAGWPRRIVPRPFAKMAGAGGNVEIAELFEEDNRSYCLIERLDYCDLT
jgi:hypothetical protein